MMCRQGTYSFVFEFTCFILFIYLLVDVLMYTFIIMRDNILYLLVNQSITTVSIIGLVKTRL